MEKSNQKNNSAHEYKAWSCLEVSFAMFTPDYMTDGRNQPEMQKREAND